MFLWWSKKPDGSEPTPEELQHEVEDLRHELTTTTLSRPSPVSRAKYNKWVVAEDNRNTGAQVRLENEELANTRETTRAEFLESTSQRTQGIRDGREAAGERVRAYRAELQERGQLMKSEIEDQKATMRELKQAWQAHGARTVHLLGTEQRERVMEARTERDESRRHAAMSHKQAMLDRSEAHLDESNRKLEEKRQRVARIRAETNPDLVATSKAFFYEQRRAQADDVRQSVGDWRAERAYNNADALERARQNRDDGLESQRNAIDGKKILEAQRRQAASEMRDSIRSIELHKEHMKLSSEAAKRELHDDAFENKFVPPPQAVTVETSTLETVANSHREELAARGGLPMRATGKPDWMSFFGNTSRSSQDGFFNGWFS